MSEYPTQQQLNELRDAAREIAIDWEVWDTVVNIIIELWDGEYGKLEYSEETGILILITGGWSGNEDILNALTGSIFDMCHWYSSERGGKHVYRREL